MGQLNELYHYARTHNVTHVVLAVGANDFDFSGVIKECMESTEAHISASAVAATTPHHPDAISTDEPGELEENIYGSLQALSRTMEHAGYDWTDYTLILQNYWSAIPSDKDIWIDDVRLRPSGAMWASHSRSRCDCAQRGSASGDQQQRAQRRQEVRDRYQIGSSSWTCRRHSRDTGCARRGSG